VVPGAKCEGKRIPGLAKVRKWKYAEKESEIPESKETADNMDEEYILGKLLNKSLLNGAMKHDTIVDACEYLHFD